MFAETTMRLLISLFLLFAVATATAGDAGLPATPVASAATQNAEQACLEQAGRRTGADRLAQAGSCGKGHKGVCGCRAGKIVCCDKSFATGCTCNQDEPPATL